MQKSFFPGLGEDMKKSIPLLITSMVILLTAACSSEPSIVITNRSGVTLGNVVISGSGFSQHIGRLSPNAVTRLTVHPKGPSGVRVAFDASGRHFDTKEAVGFFREKGRYLVDILIGPDLRLTVLSESRGY